MSYCELIEFKDSKPDRAHEFGNSHGGAARIWTALFEKYLKNPAKPYDSWLTRGMDPANRDLWDLAKREDLPLFERAVHVATFDNAIVGREHFAEFAGHLREFDAAYPCPGCVNHLPQWADVVANSTAEAIGFYMMSVGDNPWYEWDEETEDSVAYDLATGKKHFEVYEYLAEH
jgi:hypothetical protein